MIGRIVMAIFCSLGWHDRDVVMTDEGRKWFCRECGASLEKK